MPEPGTFRVALVGFGRIARRHITALETLSPQLELVAICDPCLADPSILTPEGAARHEHIDDLLAARSYDLVCVTSPSGMHREHVLAALDAGAHVLAEKPLAMTLEDARVLRAHAARAGRALFVCYQMRSYPTLRLLHKAVTEGHLGNVHAVDVRVFWTRPQDYYDAAPWRGTEAFDGGVLLNQTNHYLDLLGWILGAPVAISGREATLAREIEASDSAAFVLEWPECLGTFMASMLTYPRNLEASMTILGERGTIRLGGPACDQIEVWELANDFTTPAEREEASSRTRQMRDSGHLTLYRDLLESLDGASGQVPAVAGPPLIGAAIVDAAREASRTRRRVLLADLIPADCLES
jgi:UDP-N-acetyl-2-amino-2-deoxyglucuronate dehydrogenase